jgi:hypothetical protein
LFSVGATGNPSSIDELLFGLPHQQGDPSTGEKSDMDLLSDVLNNQSLGINDKDLNNSFASQWQSMFGSNDQPEIDSTNTGTTDETTNPTAEPDNNRMFMPSFLLDQIGKPAMGQSSKLTSTSTNKDQSKIFSKPGSTGLYGANAHATKGETPPGKDMSKWFSLFADLDPLANPDAVGATEVASDGKQAC